MTCIRCGTEFTPRTHWQTHCTRECHAHTNREKMRLRSRKNYKPAEPMPWEVRDAHETRIQQLAARYAAVPDAVLDAEPQEDV